jgi:hypothetical protein
MWDGHQSQDIEARQPLFRQKDGNHLLSSAQVCSLGITFSVFNPKKWLGTFSKAMAIEIMDTCADR